MFIIGALIALGVLIAIHELGHLSVAKYFGVYIEKFSLGFGPKLISFKYKETEYRVSLIPLGGYVKMKGENPDEETVFEEDSFQAKKWWQRALIAFSGPFFNLMFALFLFIFSFLIGRTYDDHSPILGSVTTEFSEYLQPQDKVLKVNDQPVIGWNHIPLYTKEDEPNTFLIRRNSEEFSVVIEQISKSAWFTDLMPEVPPIIGEVATGMPAYRSGMKTGDRIIKVDDQKVDSWYEMREKIAYHTGQNVVLKIERNNEIIELDVPLESNVLDDGHSKMIGIMQYYNVSYNEKYNLAESIHYGFNTTASFVILNYQAIFKLFTNPGLFKDSIGGPVMMVSMSKQTVERGWSRIITFIASISILLMIMNLLPIPVLDGGHIFFCFIEGIFRKRPSLKLQGILQQIGFLLLISLMIFAFYNDFNRIIQRNISLRQQEQSSNR